MIDEVEESEDDESDYDSEESSSSSEDDKIINKRGNMADIRKGNFKKNDKVNEKQKSNKKKLSK